MKVTILGKEVFDSVMRKAEITDDNVEQKRKTFFVSINDTQGTDAVPYFKEHKNVKVMFFDDIEEDVYHPKYGWVKAFSEEQAKELFEFIKKQSHNPLIEQCFVHCSAGISRSGAVGTFINEYFGGNYKKFINNNKYIHPNGKVLALLNAELRKELELENK